MAVEEQLLLLFLRRFLLFSQMSDCFESLVNDAGKGVYGVDLTFGGYQAYTYCLLFLSTPCGMSGEIYKLFKGLVFLINEIRA